MAPTRRPVSLSFGPDESNSLRCCRTSCSPQKPHPVGVDCGLALVLDEAVAAAVLGVWVPRLAMKPQFTQGRHDL